MAIDGPEIITAEYKVNLHCVQCAREIRKPLTRTQGVQKVDIDIEENKITVKGRVDATEIRERIEKKSKKKVEVVSFSTIKEVKELVVITAVIKVPIHCEKCEHDLKRVMLKHKGVHSVKIDSKAQTCTVETSTEPAKLVEYLRKKANKHAEIVIQKQEKKVKKEEKKAEVQVEEVKVKAQESLEVVEEKKVCPYCVQYGYPPQLFSDENPNACYVM